MTPPLKLPFTLSALPIAPFDPSWTGALCRRHRIDGVYHPVEVIGRVPGSEDFIFFDTVEKSVRNGDASAKQVFQRSNTGDVWCAEIIPEAPMAVVWGAVEPLLRELAALREAKPAAEVPGEETQEAKVLGAIIETRNRQIIDLQAQLVTANTKLKEAQEEVQHRVKTGASDLQEMLRLKTLLEEKEEAFNTVSDALIRADQKLAVIHELEGPEPAAPAAPFPAKDACISALLELREVMLAGFVQLQKEREPQEKNGPVTTGPTSFRLALSRAKNMVSEAVEAKKDEVLKW